MVEKYVEASILKDYMLKISDTKHRSSAPVTRGIGVWGPDYTRASVKAICGSALSKDTMALCSFFLGVGNYLHNLDHLEFDVFSSSGLQVLLRNDVVRLDRRILA